MEVRHCVREREIERKRERESASERASERERERVRERKKEIETEREREREREGGREIKNVLELIVYRTAKNDQRGLLHCGNLAGRSWGAHTGQISQEQVEPDLGGYNTTGR